MPAETQRRQAHIACAAASAVAGSKPVPAQFESQNSRVQSAGHLELNLDATRNVSLFEPMYCTNCGQQLRDESNFCSQCGQSTRPSSWLPAGGGERLVRIREGKKIAGVCAGFARYMGVDVTL